VKIRIQNHNNLENCLICEVVL